MSLPSIFKTTAYKDKGFTIVELVISVGTFAALGVLILLFFISSKDVVLRTEDIDRGLYHTNNIIESIKLESWEEEPLKNFKVLSVDGKYANLTSLYDKNWNHTSNEKDALFRTNISLNKESSNIEKSLYSVTVEVVRLKGYFRSNETTPVVNTITTVLYIPTTIEEILK